MADKRTLTFDFLLNDKLSAGMDKIGQHSEKLHGRLGKLGSAGMGGLTKAAGVAGAGLAALGLSVGAIGDQISKGLDAQAATSKLRAQLDLTTAESKKIGSTAGKLYSQAYGESMDEVKTSIATVIQNMDGMRSASSKSLQDVTGRAMNLATIMDEEVGGVTRAVSQLMRTGLVKSTTEAFDLITKSFQQGGNASEDLLDTINEYSTQFREVGISGPKAIGLITQAARAGAPSLDFAADAIKEFAIRSKDGSALSRGAFKALGLDADHMFKIFATGGPAADKAFGQVTTKLKGIENPTKRNTLAVALFGAKAEDLGKSLYAMDPSKAVSSLGKIGGASDRAGKALGDNLKTKLTGFKRTIETNVTSFIETKVLPSLSKLGNQVSKGFKAGDVGKNATLFEKFGAATKKAGDWAQKSLVPALKNLGHWIEDKVMPAASKFYGSVLKGMGDAFKKVKKSIDDNKGSLSSLGGFLTKVGNIVVKYVVPAIGWFYGHVLKNWGTALGIVIKIVANSWKVVSFLGKTVFAVGNQIVKTFLFMAGSVLKAADRAFGWMPGIGPKIKKANKEFDGFAKKVNASINSITKKKDVRIGVKASGSWSMLAPGRTIEQTKATGGAIHGPGTGTSDDVPIWASTGEHMWTAEETRKVGGHAKMLRLRTMAKKGMLALAGGGPVGVGVSTSLPAAGTGSAMFQPITSGVTAMIKKVATALAKAGGGAMGVVAAVRKMIGYPYSWGGGGAGGPSFGIGRGAGTYGFDCSGLAEYGWWQGARKHIGGTTMEQEPRSRPSPRRPGALGFVGHPTHHVMIASDRPGYVIQAPFTGSHVQEVQRSSSNWRWPMATGGPVSKNMSGWEKASTKDPWNKATLTKPKPKPKPTAALKYGWTAPTEAADAWQRVFSPYGSAWIRQRDPLSIEPWGRRAIRRAAAAKDPWANATYSPWGHEVARLGDGFTRGVLNTGQASLLQAAMIAGGATVRPRARGGRVYPGMSYLVGERGPEVMSPGTPGTIHPNGAGAGTVVYLTVNLNGPAVGTKREFAEYSLSALRQAKKQGVDVRIL